MPSTSTPRVRRSSSPVPPPARAVPYDTVARDTVVRELEATVRALRATVEANSRRINALQAQIDHLDARRAR